MINPEHLPELVRMARQHGYDRAEGFAEVLVPTAHLPEELAEKLADLAEELVDPSIRTEMSVSQKARQKFPSTPS